MPKNKDIDLDLEIDDFDELDFDIDGKVESSPPKNTREAVSYIVKESGKGFLEGVAGGDSASSIFKNSIKKSIPESISYEVSDLISTYEEVKDSVSEGFNSLKRDGKKAVDKLKQIIPGDHAFNRMLSKISDKLGGEEERRQKEESEESIRNREIQEAILGSLGEQKTLLQQQEAVRQEFQNIHQANSLSVMKNMLIELRTQNTFNTNISNNYYRKSLEIQFKHYYSSAELLNLTKLGFETFKNQLEAIVKNTSLPEIVKLRESENISRAIGDKFRKEFADTIYKKVNPFQDSKEKLLKSIERSFKGFRGGITDFLGLTETLDFAGNSSLPYMVGSTIGDYLNTKMFRPIRKVIEGSEFGNSIGEHLAELTTDTRGYLKRFSGNDFLNPLINFLTSKNKYQEAVNFSKDPSAPAILDNYLKMSITRVIPDYLSNIHSELKSIRMGLGGIKIGGASLAFEDPEQYKTTYDYKTDTFKTKDERKNLISKKFGYAVQDSLMASSSLASIAISYGGLPERFKRSFQQFTQLHLLNRNASLNLESFKNSKYLKSTETSPFTKVEIEAIKSSLKKIIKATRNIKRGGFGLRKDWNISALRVLNNMPNLDRIVDWLVESGNRDIAQELNLVEIDSRGDLKSNYEGQIDYYHKEILTRPEFLDRENYKHKEYEPIFLNGRLNEYNAAGVAEIKKANTIAKRKDLYSTARSNSTKIKTLTGAIKGYKKPDQSVGVDGRCAQYVSDTLKTRGIIPKDAHLGDAKDFPTTLPKYGFSPVSINPAEISENKTEVGDIICIVIRRKDRDELIFQHVSLKVSKQKWFSDKDDGTINNIAKLLPIKGITKYADLKPYLSGNKSRTSLEITLFRKGEPSVLGPGKGAPSENFILLNRDGTASIGGKAPRSAGSISSIFRRGLERGVNIAEDVARGGYNLVEDAVNSGRDAWANLKGKSKSATKFLLSLGSTPEERQASLLALQTEYYKLKKRVGDKVGSFLDWLKETKGFDIRDQKFANELIKISSKAYSKFKKLGNKATRAGATMFDSVKEKVRGANLKGAVKNKYSKIKSFAESLGGTPEERELALASLRLKFQKEMSLGNLKDKAGKAITNFIDYLKSLGILEDWETYRDYVKENIGVTKEISSKWYTKIKEKTIFYKDKIVDSYKALRGGPGQLKSFLMFLGKTDKERKNRYEELRTQYRYHIENGFYPSTTTFNSWLKQEYGYNIDSSLLVSIGSSIASIGSFYKDVTRKFKKANIWLKRNKKRLLEKLSSKNNEEDDLKELGEEEVKKFREEFFESEEFKNGTMTNFKEWLRSLGFKEKVNVEVAILRGLGGGIKKIKNYIFNKGTLTDLSTLFKLGSKIVDNPLMKKARSLERSILGGGLALVPNILRLLWKGSKLGVTLPFKAFLGGAGLLAGVLGRAGFRAFESASILLMGRVATGIDNLNNKQEEANKKERKNGWIARMKNLWSNKKDETDPNKNNKSVAGFIKNHPVLSATGVGLVALLISKLGVTMESVKNFTRGMWSGVKNMVKGVFWVGKTLFSFANTLFNPLESVKKIGKSISSFFGFGSGNTDGNIDASSDKNMDKAQLPSLEVKKDGPGYYMGTALGVLLPSYLMVKMASSVKNLIAGPLGLVKKLGGSLFGAIASGAGVAVAGGKKLISKLAPKGKIKPKIAPSTTKKRILPFSRGKGMLSSVYNIGLGALGATGLASLLNIGEEEYVDEDGNPIPENQITATNGSDIESKVSLGNIVSGAGLAYGGYEAAKIGASAVRGVKNKITKPPTGKIDKDPLGKPKAKGGFFSALSKFFNWCVGKIPLPSNIKSFISNKIFTKLNELTSVVSSLADFSKLWGRVKKMALKIGKRGIISTIVKVGARLTAYLAGLISGTATLGIGSLIALGFIIYDMGWVAKYWLYDGLSLMNAICKHYLDVDNLFDNDDIDGSKADNEKLPAIKYLGNGKFQVSGSIIDRSSAVEIYGEDMIKSLESKTGVNENTDFSKPKNNVILDEQINRSKENVRSFVYKPLDKEPAVQSNKKTSTTGVPSNNKITYNSNSWANTNRGKESSPKVPGEEKFLNTIIKEVNKTGWQSQEKAMFLSNIDNETGGFKSFSENLNYKNPEWLRKTFSKVSPWEKSTGEKIDKYIGNQEMIANIIYGGRMGNGEWYTGDGWKYRGRGPIQVTGLDNYRTLSKKLGVDLVKNPDLLLTDPTISARSSIEWWETAKKTNREFKKSATTTSDDPKILDKNVTITRKITNAGRSDLPENRYHGIENTKSLFFDKYWPMVKNKFAERVELVKSAYNKFYSDSETPLERSNGDERNNNPVLNSVTAVKPIQRDAPVNDNVNLGSTRTSTPDINLTETNNILNKQLLVQMEMNKNLSALLAISTESAKNVTKEVISTNNTLPTEAINIKRKKYV